MTFVIRALGFADGTDCPQRGQYLASFDFEAYAGRGRGVFTPNLRHALHFTDKRHAFEFYMTVPKNMRRQQDGKLNRPLTALSIEILPLGDALLLREDDVRPAPSRTPPATEDPQPV